MLSKMLHRTEFPHHLHGQSMAMLLFSRQNIATGECTSLSTQMSSNGWLTALVTTLVVLAASTLCMLLLMHVVIPLFVACVQRSKRGQVPSDASVASKDHEIPANMLTFSDSSASNSSSTVTGSADQSSSPTRSSSVMSALRGAWASSCPSSNGSKSGSVHRYVGQCFLYLTCYQHGYQH